MKKIFIFILNIVITFQTLALTPYEAKYNLSAKTELGHFKIGSAKYRLIIDDNDKFTFISEAYSDPVWESLFDYSRHEKSIGLKINGQLTSTYYDLIEIEKGIVNHNYQFKVYPENNYAIISGIEYNDEHLEIEDNPILDSLSVYLALAEDIIANPSQTEFVYQVAGERGVEEEKFEFIGLENITINGNNINTIKVSEPKEGITFNLAKDYNFMPAVINRVSDDKEFKLTLTKFNELN
ncbi:MAG: DUF3108 domain-containing protein [Candidatus Marinimicrobia bacterium]|nr:DUF3108 domain-containing protein [Candidatus Neomarinimicrobiota bacterium]